MKTMAKALTIAIVASAPFAASLQSAQARDDIFAETNRINYNGFQKCQELGNTGYKASAAGYSLDGGGGIRSGSGVGFRINTCFETKAQCERFIDRIHHHVTTIQRLYHAGCFARG